VTGLDAPVVAAARARAVDRRIERTVGRVLAAGTYVSVACLVAGVLGMLAAGLSPLSADHPTLDPGRLASDIFALRPAGFLWLGIVVAVAMPATRVAASLVGYVADGDRRMAAISVAILFVIALGVVLSTITSA
jgi:uncharacterized membrane protein